MLVSADTNQSLVRQAIGEWSNMNVAVRHVKSGQQHPYGDHEYESIIFVYDRDLDGNISPSGISDLQAKELARTLVRGFNDNPDPNDWAATKFKWIKPEPNPFGFDYEVQTMPWRIRGNDSVLTYSCCWRVLIVTPYID